MVLDRSCVLLAIASADTGEETVDDQVVRDDIQWLRPKQGLRHIDCMPVANLNLIHQKGIGNLVNSNLEIKAHRFISVMTR